MSRIYLLTRGDDAGSCASANRAILEACDAGTLRNVSVMVPGPAFQEAIDLFRGRRDVCLGLHVTLNAEWDGPKWKPVLPPERVPSLVNARGSFWPTPHHLEERRVPLEEMLAEVGAQLARAQSAGLRVEYLDEHMGVGRVCGLRPALAEMAAGEGLVYAPDLPSLPRVSEASADLLENWIARLDAAAPGAYLLVTHPGCDSEEMRAFVHAGLEPGQVARERDAERRALSDPRLLEALRERQVVLLSYREAVDSGMLR